MRFFFWLVRIAVGAVLAGVLGGCATPIDFGPTSASSPGAITGVGHLLLSVADLDLSKHFYRDVLGMKLEFGTRHFVMLRAGNFGVALSDRPWDFEKKGEPKGIGMIPHFLTPDMDQLAVRLKNNNIPWLRGPIRESYGIEAFITDPNGYQWAILAPLNPKGGGTGND